MTATGVFALYAMPYGDVRLKKWVTYGIGNGRFLCHNSVACQSFVGKR